MTADEIRAKAAGANIVQAAPTSVNTPPKASTTDQVNAAPSVSLEKQVEALQAQLAQALGIIATISPKAVAAVEGERTYHSSVPFVAFHAMKGVGVSERFQFKGNKFTTNDPHAIAFLESAIQAGNSGFSHAPIPNKPTLEELEMKKDVMGAAIIARDKMVAAGEKVA